MTSVEQMFWDAARRNYDSEVSSLLEDYPELNVNWVNNNQWSALHSASFNSHVEVVELLLAHPSIDVNVKNEDGDTPFLYCCLMGGCSIAAEGSSRLDVTLDDRECTPLWYASYTGTMK